jgi:integrase
MPVLRMTKSLADEFRKYRHAKNALIKDATINRDLSVLRRILYWGVDEQLLVASPLARMKMARERRTRRQVLSLAEEQRLLGCAKDHLYGMAIMALDTGMRRGEITNQLWEDIDFSRKVLFVTHSKTPEGEAREIPLTDRLLDYLLENRKENGRVITFNGRNVRIVKRSWRTALKNAKVRYVRFHDLRHTFNTRLMEAGVLQEIRMALMGHSSGSKVHSIYTHIELPAKRKAIRALEAWASQQRDELRKQEKKDATAEAPTPPNLPYQSSTRPQVLHDKESRRRVLGQAKKVRSKCDGGRSSIGS